mgnify:FL=1
MKNKRVSSNRHRCWASSSRRKCVYCGDPGPYCDECPECLACHADEPGDWKCSGGDHDLDVIHECVDCDEGERFCSECSSPCIVCNKVMLCLRKHKCRKCPKGPVCVQCGFLPRLLPDTFNRDIYCPEHLGSCGHALLEQDMEQLAPRILKRLRLTKLSLFKVSLPSNVSLGYDSYSEFICVAHDEAEARQFHPCGDFLVSNDEAKKRKDWISDTNTLVVTHLGYANPEVFTVPDVVIATYYPG